MDYRNLLIALEFSPKENSSDIFFKEYQQADNYCIEVDVEKQTIYYGEKIKTGRDNCLIFNEQHEENVVTLECVNRLLEKGYKPENIVLEKAFPLGHGGGFGDILVTRDDGSTYLMIECKTYGEKYNYELKKILKDGGQLLTYFQQDTKTELLMLYASDLVEDRIVSEYKIINIEEEFRSAGNVENVFKLWKGTFNDFKFWELPPYEFKEKVFTKAQLIELTEKEGDGLFNKFAEVLRKHSVSDKPNAFSVIFNLFLAKLQDEQKKEDDELEFQWKENDDSVDFQVRLHNLHKEGLDAFLKKEVAGIYDKDFDGKTGDALREAKKRLLMFNRFFTIKEVFDDETFNQNHRVLKEVVQLIEKYRIRYPRKQKYLSEFFERLLTIGLKQEVGQYFTPPPITKFIIRSLPLQSMIENELNNVNPKLPAAIDYAAGSGHFLTEIMEEYQEIIDKLDTSNYYPDAIRKVKSWSKDGDPYSWAPTYIYGIEKDYRLVKVAKVGCYFYGDGLAQVVHGDGLDSFEKSKAYRGLLKDNANKPQFSIIVSNPPYSVNDCKDDLEYIYDQYNEKPTNFEIYNSLTYNSKEIECLFVERTKQLLKDGGVAGIVLPSSIFSNTGIYTKTREIILQYFEIIAVTELGSNTFMATGTNTVVLFLRKRNENDVEKIKTNAYNNLEHYKKTKEERVTNGIEKPISKYLEHTEEAEINPEKFYYFVLNYGQKTIIVKTGAKEEEKRFLGYEYSNRRGHEGMHAIQSGKSIDDCTKLYNVNNLEDPQKASSYIYKAFHKEYPEIHESLKNNISCVNLVDMITFDREKFEKIISLAVKKKITIESNWEISTIENLCEIGRGRVINKKEIEENFGEYPVYSSQTSNDGIFGYLNTFDFEGEYATWTTDGIYAGSVFYRNGKFNCTNVCGTLKAKTDKINMKFLSFILPLFTQDYVVRVANPKLMNNVMAQIKIPLPTKDIQEKIVSEIEVLEKKEAEAKEKVEKGKEKIEQLFTDAYNKANATFRLSDNIFDVSIGKRVIEADLDGKGTIPVYSANVFEPFGYIDKYLIEDFSVPSVLWGIDGDWMVNYMPADKPFYPTDHCGVLRIKTNEILPKYFAWVLNKEGIERNFSRVLRASIDRIKGLSVKVPPLSEQQQIVSEIEKIELEIAENQKVIDNSPELKNEILRKYL